MSSLEDVPATAAQPRRLLCPAEAARLYEAHRRELLLFLTGVLRDAHLAADVMQTAYSRLLEQGGEVAEESRKAWLFKVAFNEAIGLRRKETRRDRLLPEAAATRPFYGEAPILEPSAELIQGEEVGKVREAILRLSPSQQEIVRRRVYQQQTFAEIARELQIPLGTALGRMRQAMEQLRKLLKEE